MKRYLLIDGLNMTHAANGMKRLTVGEVEVQAIFGFLRILRKVLSVYPNVTPVVLWDGASWRHMSFPDYKQNRKKEETPSQIKQKVAYDSAIKQTAAIKKAFEFLGVAQVRSNNMEADDLAAIIGDRYVQQGHRVIMMSGDKDWVQLVQPGMIWFDPIQDRKIMKAEDIEPALGYKVSSFKQFLELKCIMGDLGDNISGVGGIGEKGAIEFLEKYGSVANFSNMVLDGSIDPATLPKKIRDFAESEEKQIIFQRNLRLMDLRTPHRPEPINLTVNKGEASRERFKALCDRLMFLSITKVLDDWLSVFPAFSDTQKDIAA